ncbi:hypothetical protein EVA_12417, partial [gut metagenome]
MKKGECVIPDDLPVLQTVIAHRLDSLARAHVYDLLIKAQYQNNKYPQDEQLYHSTDKNKGYTKKQLTIPEAYTFSTYAEFVQRLDDVSLPVDVHQMFVSIMVDLQCRLPLFRMGEFNTKLNQLKQEEDKTHAIRDALKADKEFQKYICWYTYAFDKNLNAEANQNPSKLIDKAVMAGYMALSGDFPSVIVLPLERVYSRIWFHFQWMGLQEAESIEIDSIVVDGLHYRTQMFNVANGAENNNPKNPLISKSAIINRDKENCSQPFLGDLTKNAYPYHLGKDPALYFEAANSNLYNTVCRYTCN